MSGLEVCMHSHVIDITIIIHAVRDCNNIINDISNVNSDHFETLEFGQHDGVDPGQILLSCCLLGKESSGQSKSHSPATRKFPEATK